MVVRSRVEDVPGNLRFLGGPFDCLKDVSLEWTASHERSIHLTQVYTSLVPRPIKASLSTMG
jgi:hypothetical protein